MLELFHPGLPVPLRDYKSQDAGQKLDGIFLELLSVGLDPSSCLPKAAVEQHCLDSRSQPNENQENGLLFVESSF